MKRVMLVGNPNCGKTTLFNGLTGSNQRVGNWPGVTIEKKLGFYTDLETIEVTDLPGVYSLSLPTSEHAKDAQITAQMVAARDMDLIINVVDACHLERHLYLTSQLLELGKPMVIALNMMDIATQNGITIDTQQLSHSLNCPVVILQAHREIGLDDLRAYIRSCDSLPLAEPLLRKYLPPNITQYFATLQKELLLKYDVDKAKYYAYRLLEQNGSANQIEDIDVLVADARYQLVHSWVKVAQTKNSDAKEHFTATLDRIVLHRFWALPIFFSLMYLVFFLAIGVGGAFQGGFDILSKSLFVHAPEYALTQLHAPAWLITILAHGIGQAFNTILTFIPVLAIMYFLLAFLESSGYMARAAFVVDRLMRRLGLPGQAFVPMIVGFGCNVPAIMAARTMRSERDRFLTVLMNPYMSCSARLAIYAVFVAAFFPNRGYQIIFSLYICGIGMAILTGYVVRHLLLKGKPTPLILELPAYHSPSMKRLCKEASLRLRYFLSRAGRVVVPVCMVLSALNAWAIGDHPSLLAFLGKLLTPIFEPMGIQEDNWPAVVSLITGMLAKEVVIGTLNSLYLQINHVTEMVSLDLVSACQQALHSIYEHLLQLCSFSSEPMINTHESIYGMLSIHFGSGHAAYAYLLFVLLYIPCVSTMAAIRQEANRRLMWFSIIWSLVLAYVVAVMFYQCATWALHTHHTMVYGLGLLVLLAVLGMRWMVKMGGPHVVSTS
ncbi:MAG TPA: Fe(2+) transporter permease subunit FeoB [Legionellaceae bacterium]|nr:Fe(2+) transporter permease subunit FeoB [Legionellaceae bacterium]